MLLTNKQILQVQLLYKYCTQWKWKLVAVKWHNILCTLYKSREFIASSQSSAAALFWLQMTVKFPILPRSWQAQSQLQQSLFQETETENTQHLISCTHKCQKCFNQLYRNFQHSSTVEGGGKWGAKERKWMGFLISQLRSCDRLFAHVSMHVHTGVTEHS